MKQNKIIALRLDENTSEQLKAIAKKERRSLSQIIRFIILDFLGVKDNE